MTLIVIKLMFLYKVLNSKSTVEFKKTLNWQNFTLYFSEMSSFVCRKWEFVCYNLVFVCCNREG